MGSSYDFQLGLSVLAVVAVTVAFIPCNRIDKWTDKRLCIGKSKTKAMLSFAPNTSGQLCGNLQATSKCSSQELREIESW